MNRFVALYLLMILCYSLSCAQKAPYALDRLLASIKKDTPISFTTSGAHFESPSLESWLESLGVRKQEVLAPRLVKGNSSLPVLISFKQTVDIPAMIAVMEASGLYEFVEPDFKGCGAGRQGVIPNEPLFSRQWGLVNDGTFDAKSVVDADIDMEEAWEITQGDSTIIVASLDSGINPDHPEFVTRLWNNTDEIPNNNVDDDRNGYVDDIWGWDFVVEDANDVEDNNPRDDYGHGTNVTSILAATGDNGLGYAGVDWHCKIMTGKILDSENFGFYSWWTKAIYYAVDNGADVINMSVGGSTFSQSMQQAVTYAYDRDVPIAVSMMNVNNAVPYYPAAYDETIAVGATDTDNRRANPFFWNSNSGSNYGVHIDLAAPGNFMYGAAYNNFTNYNTFWGGTSQATPLVTGVMSLMKAIDPTLSVDSIRSLLRLGAVDLLGDPTEDTEGWDHFHGAGLLNAYNSLSLLTLVSTSLDDELTSEQLSIYPNPGNGSYTLEGGNDWSEWRASIVDLQGKEITMWETLYSQPTFQLRANSGMYLLILTHKERNLSLSKKIFHQEP